MNWLDICALDEINALGSRIISGPKGDIAMKSLPSPPAARTRAGRYPKA